jgi:lysophospholipase L1-like esterase
MRVENPPGYIVLHVGGNDLGYVKVGFLRNRIKNIIRKIRILLPNTRIIWSEILPRNQWGYSQKESIAAFVLQLGGYYIQYPDIALEMQFFKRDGVHLTDLGNEIFLNILHGALVLCVVSQFIIGDRRVVCLSKVPGNWSRQLSPHFDLVIPIFHRLVLPRSI